MIKLTGYQPVPPYVRDRLVPMYLRAYPGTEPPTRITELYDAVSAAYPPTQQEYLEVHYIRRLLGWLY